MEIIHFNTQKERLDYIKGNFNEIEPIVAKAEAVEKPKKAKKTAKKSKKEAKNDEIQAE